MVKRYYKKLSRIGGSQGIIFPRDVLEFLGWDLDTLLVLEASVSEGKKGKDAFVVIRPLPGIGQ